MKNILFLLFFLSPLIVHTQISYVILNPSKPEAGQKITIIYSGKLAKEGTKMSHIFCFDDNYRMPVKVIPTQLIDNQLVGSFIIPDSVSFFRIKITNKKEIDNNNGEGYGFNVFEGGKIKKGAFFSQGYTSFWNKFNFNGEFDPDKGLQLIEKEYQLNPELKKSTLPYYIEHLSRVPNRKVEAINLAKENFEDILNNINDEKHSYRYANIIANGKYKIADSLKNLVIQKYPNGYAAIKKNLELFSYYSQVKPDTVISLSKNVLRNNLNLNIGQKRDILVELLGAYAQKCDFGSLDSTLNLLMKNDNSEQVFIMVGSKLNEVAWGLSSANKDLKQAKIIIEKSIWSHQRYDTLSTFLGNSLDTYAGILFKLGDKKNAIINQKKAVYLKNYTFRDLNQRLIQYLIEDNQFQEAKILSEEFIKDNSSNPIIDSLHKVAYLSTIGSEKGYEKVNSIVKEKAERDNITALRKKIINIDAFDFKLKDLNGKSIKLSDFRGSVVVLDFWATWCTPCIGSFPAMKKVMYDLRDKPVKFLFVDTMENEKLENKNEKIHKILSIKKVEDFQVLIDEMKDLNYEVTTAYNVQSIPAKFVIDSNGKLRYKSIGFSSEENLIKELKSVIKIISE